MSSRRRWSRTFNCGIGMVAIVGSGEADEVVTARSRRQARRSSASGKSKAGDRGCTVNGPDGSWTATHNA